MADVRALLAAERQARRIQHPHATYSKTGVLSCSVCRLAIKSESLWDGHLRSANHKKNVQATGSRPVPTPSINLPAIPRTSLKRKIEDVDTDADVQQSEHRANLKPRDAESSNKKSKSRQVSFATEVSTISLPRDETESSQDQEQDQDQEAHDDAEADQPPTEGNTVPAQPPSNPIDEDQWAAFERDVVPLASSNPLPAPSTSIDPRNRYSATTISAAPISSSETQAQAQTSEENKRKRLLDDAEDEREEERQRIQDEFEVLEEMEDRVRKLRERREALRTVKDGAGSVVRSDLNAESRVDDGDMATDEDRGGREEDVDVNEEYQNGTNHDPEINGHDDNDDEDDGDGDVDDWYS